MTEERLRELLFELINCAADHNDAWVDALKEQIVGEVMEGEGMDYRELLIKYIAHVRSEAGYDYLLYVPLHQMNVEEAKELCKLSKESERYYE